MQKTKGLLRTNLFFLCGVVSRIFLLNPAFKRFARLVLCHLSIIEHFYARLTASPPSPRKHMLTSHAAIIFSDLKDATSQIKSNDEKAPPFKGG